MNPDDDELVSNPDEANPDDSFNCSELDEHQLLSKRRRASQMAIIKLRMKMAASAEKVNVLNNMVAGLKEELDDSKEVIRLSKSIVTNVEVSTQIQMNKNQTVLEKLEASSAKTVCTLDKRTERFTVFRKKKDAEMSMLCEKNTEGSCDFRSKTCSKVGKGGMESFQTRACANKRNCFFEMR